MVSQIEAISGPQITEELRQPLSRLEFLKFTGACLPFLGIRFKEGVDLGGMFYMLHKLGIDPETVKLHKSDHLDSFWRPQTELSFLSHNPQLCRRNSLPHDPQPDTARVTIKYALTNRDAADNLANVGALLIAGTRLSKMIEAIAYSSAGAALMAGLSPNLLQEIQQFIKAHKKPIVAGGLLAGVVGAVLACEVSSLLFKSEQTPEGKATLDVFSTLLATSRGDTPIPPEVNTPGGEIPTPINEVKVTPIPEIPTEFNGISLTDEWLKSEGKRNETIEKAQPTPVAENVLPQGPTNESPTEYTRQVFNLDKLDIATNSVDSLRFAVAQGVRQGTADGVTYYSNGISKENPAYEGLAIFRAIVNQDIYLDAGAPNQLYIKNGSGISVIGKTEDGRIAIAFEEYIKRQDTDTSPTIRFAVISQEQFAFIVNQNTTSARFVPDERRFIYQDKKNGVDRGIEFNSVSSEITDALEMEAGYVWIENYPMSVSPNNEIISALHPHPVVPRPRLEEFGINSDFAQTKFEIVTDYSKIGSADAVSVQLRDLSTGMLLLVARYLDEKKKWEWQKPVLEWAADLETGKVIPNEMFPFVGAINNKHRQFLDITAFNGMKIAWGTDVDLTNETDQTSLRQDIEAKIHNNEDLRKQLQALQLQDPKNAENYRIIIEGERITQVVLLEKSGLKRFHYEIDGSLTPYTKEEEPPLLPELHVNGAYLERTDNIKEAEDRRIELKGVGLNAFMYGQRPLEETFGLIDKVKSLGYNFLRLQLDVGRLRVDNLERVITYAERQGMYVFITPTSYHGDDLDTPNQYYNDAIVKYAELFKNKTNVLYGLINEVARPQGDRWWYNLMDTAKAIRAQNPTAVLLLPGWFWNMDFSIVNRIPFGVDNIAFDAHYYQVVEDDGTDSTALKMKLTPILGKYPVIFGEAGVPGHRGGKNNPQDAVYINKMLALTYQYPYSTHWAAYELATDGGITSLLDLDGRYSTRFKPYLADSSNPKSTPATDLTA